MALSTLEAGYFGNAIFMLLEEKEPRDGDKVYATIGNIEVICKIVD
jgi:hypothetical protein